MHGGAEIVGFTDDDQRNQGQRLWGWPIVAPEKAASELGATDVVISSWMFQEQIWERRAVYEGQGVTVHRMYSDPALANPQTEGEARWRQLSPPTADTPANHPTHTP
jgi:hypothetical protein